VTQLGDNSIEAAARRGVIADLRQRAGGSAIEASALAAIEADAIAMEMHDTEHGHDHIEHAESSIWIG
jgi:hypothetical protein